MNGNIAAARAIKNTLLQLETSSRMNNNSKTSITQDDFFVGEVIASIGESPESFENMFDELKKNVKTLYVSQINSIIRVLGRQRKISKIFEVLQIIRKADIRPNDETLVIEKSIALFQLHTLSLIRFLLPGVHVELSGTECRGVREGQNND